MGRTIDQAVHDACLWLPEVDERPSHGMASFRVRGKTFAYYTVNHHGDGRMALWLNLAPGAQDLYVGSDPKRFFVPQYLGSRGWLGIDLNKGLAWRRIAELVREAYEKVAPAALQPVSSAPRIEPPTQKLSAADINPMLSARGKKLLKTLRDICLPLPETREVVQFGYPVWQAGKKTYVWARCTDQRLILCFWVGVEAQGLLTADERYRIPAYMGHNGWIALDVHEHCDRAEVAALALQSYRHFATKRMLKNLAPEKMS